MANIRKQPVLHMSDIYAPTLKEDPSDADIASAKLLTRAGMIRKEAAGLYTFLPLGMRVLNKVEAAMTSPLLAATMRTPLTMNSRAMMIMTGQLGSEPSSTKTSSAATTRTLSASGSMNLPKSVTSLRERAKYPSSQSVHDMATKTRAAIHAFQGLRASNPIQSGQGLMSATTNTGTRQIRTKVTTLAGVSIFSQERRSAGIGSPVAYDVFAPLRMKHIAFHFIHKRIAYSNANDFADFPFI